MDADELAHHDRITLRLPFLRLPGVIQLYYASPEITNITILITNYYLRVPPIAFSATTSFPSVGCPISELPFRVLAENKCTVGWPLCPSQRSPVSHRISKRTKVKALTWGQNRHYAQRKWGFATLLRGRFCNSEIEVKKERKQKTKEVTKKKKRAEKDKQLSEFFCFCFYFLAVFFSTFERKKKSFLCPGVYDWLLSYGRVERLSFHWH